MLGSQVGGRVGVGVGACVGCRRWNLCRCHSHHPLNPVRHTVRTCCFPVRARRAAAAGLCPWTFPPRRCAPRCTATAPTVTTVTTVAATTRHCAGGTPTGTASGTIIGRLGQATAHRKRVMAGMGRGQRRAIRRGSRAGARGGGKGGGMGRRRWRRAGWRGGCGAPLRLCTAGRCARRLRACRTCKVGRGPAGASCGGIMHRNLTWWKGLYGHVLHLPVVLSCGRMTDGMGRDRRDRAWLYNMAILFSLRLRVPPAPQSSACGTWTCPTSSTTKRWPPPPPTKAQAHNHHQRHSRHHPHHHHHHHYHFLPYAAASPHHRFLSPPWPPHSPVWPTWT